MKAVCWMGKEKMQVHDVPDPKILNPRDEQQPRVGARGQPCAKRSAVGAGRTAEKQGCANGRAARGCRLVLRSSL